MFVIDLAAQIQDETSDPALGIPNITYFIRSNLGALNNLIYRNYCVNLTTYEIAENNPDGTSCPFGIGEGAVMKLLFAINYFNKKVISSLGAAGIQVSLEATADGTTIRRLNKTTLAQVYLQAKKDAEKTLETLVTSYRIKHSRPLSVDGDDTIAGYGIYDSYFTDLYNRSLIKTF